MSTHVTLGLIPDWQFSLDPAVNPKINPFVKYPDGVYQTTPQSWGPYYGDVVSVPLNQPAGGVAGPRVTLLGGGGLGITNPFDSWWWQNRKWVALGGVSVVGAGLAAALVAILK